MSFFDRKEVKLNKLINSFRGVNLVRTFHPIGQGAFYTEVFFFEDGSRYVVVFDCGTETKEKDMFMSLEDQIKWFKFLVFDSNDKQIDLLFLSHFHADHINGLKWLLEETKVVKTIIPMLDEPTITVTRIQNFLRFNSDTAEEADGIIRRLYSGDDYLVEFGTVSKITSLDKNELDNQNENSFLSGRHITVVGTKWEYIPFNSVEQSDPKSFELNERLKQMAGDKHDLSYLLNKKLNDVKKVYREVMGNKNDNLYTLVVLSKPVDGISPYPSKRLSHCIYFGDFDYKQRRKPWERLKSLIKIEDIGTVQVPHHGSKGNWAPDMGEGDHRHYIISAGTTNKHHHPDYWVIKDIWDKGHRPYVINEKWPHGLRYVFIV